MVLSKLAKDHTWKTASLDDPLPAVAPEFPLAPVSASKEITSHISTYYALSWQENVHSWRNSTVEERDRLGVSFESRGPPSCPIYQGS